MNPFPLHTLETAPSDAKEMLARITKRFGFLPNVYAHLAEAPAALEALSELSTIFGRTSLSERQRHVLLLTSSVENVCTFCVAAHTRGAIAGGVSRQSIAAIRDRARPEDAEDAAMAAFVRAMIHSKGFVSDAEVAAFLAAGFAPRHALEVVLGVTLKILTNYANHLTHTELNDQLAEFRWSPSPEET
ncbi:MAG TPA: carboxymuconolactone decarboxylase family protein [Polyangiaceae bacterium]|jgi:AhpD family alkylhydroperoxidase